MARRRIRSTPPAPPEDAPRTAFGQWLQNMRQMHGLGVRELGLRIGREHSYIYALETGKLREPPMEVLVALSRELKVSILEVIRRLYGPEVENAIRQAVLQEGLGILGVDPEVSQKLTELAQTVERVTVQKAEAHAKAVLDRFVGHVMEGIRPETLGAILSPNGRKWSGSAGADPPSFRIIPFPLLREQEAQAN